jgi:deazaflavin-dependent oxidoreductase (nitroreductase family)
METPTHVIDSPSPWVARQIAEYVATHGARPVFHHHAPLLLLTYKGRKSGQWRRNCLIYGEDAGRYVLVASRGGAPTHPGWYLNLVANPLAWIQVGAEYFPVTARTATAAEKPALWDAMVEIYPEYDDYKAKTSRDIPVVILERVKSSPAGS